MKTALTPSIRLDRKDRRILALLNADASMSYSAIAREVGLSRDSVRYRIQQLKAQGLLLGFAPVVDLRKAGLQWFTIALRMPVHALGREPQLREVLRRHPWVTAVTKRLDPSGYDLLVEVWASGPDQLEAILLELRAQSEDLIADYRCSVGVAVEHVASMPRGLFSDLD